MVSGVRSSWDVSCCQDSYGNPVPAPTGGTPVTLSSDSSGTAVFATTLTGTSVTSVTIPYPGSAAPNTKALIEQGPCKQSKFAPHAHHREGRPALTVKPGQLWP